MTETLQRPAPTEALHDTERIPLPDGYHYTDLSAIPPAEVASLLRAIPGTEDLGDDYITGRRANMEAGGWQSLDVVVANNGGDLVGMGSLAYIGNDGILCDFAVRPQDRSRGLGKAIIDEQLRLAEEHGVGWLQIPNLEATNTLRSYYLEKGFIEVDDDLLARDRSSTHY